MKALIKVAIAACLLLPFPALAQEDRYLHLAGDIYIDRFSVKAHPSGNVTGTLANSRTLTTFRVDFDCNNWVYYVRLIYNEQTGWSEDPNPRPQSVDKETAVGMAHILVCAAAEQK